MARLGLCHNLRGSVFRQPRVHPRGLLLQAGQSGNPKGRSKGSRNKLGEDFIADLQAHWEKHGADAIEKVFTGRPDIYLKVVASVIPKEASVNQQVNVSQGFLKLLEDITERGKRERIEHRQLLIDRANAVDVEPEPIEA
jgi:hypothetical protein